MRRARGGAWLRLEWCEGRGGAPACVVGGEGRGYDFSGVRGRGGVLACVVGGAGRGCGLRSVWGRDSGLRCVRGGKSGAPAFA